MAKKHLLALLLCIPNLLFNTIFAANELRFAELSSINSEVCNAPAPDSFRITGISSNFISLAWQPAWPGALHTLDVLEKNSGGGWNPLYTINNVPGDAYTVYNLQAGHHYRFVIATNCNSGEPSELKAIIDGIALILELTINGRTPIAPKIAECNTIPLGKNWKGFNVSYMENGVLILNHFEFMDVSPANSGSSFFSKVQIAREKINHPIVAVDPESDWPTCFEPSLAADASFLMVRLINGGPNMEPIGWVDYKQNSNPPSIKLCPNFGHPTQPWNNTYTFNALAASNASFIPGCGDRSDSDEFSRIKVQNPFHENLNVFLPPSNSDSEKMTFRLLDMNEQIIMVYHLEESIPQISFPLKELVPGFYILSIENNETIQTLKVIKSE